MEERKARKGGGGEGRRRGEEGKRGGEEWRRRGEGRR